MGLEVVPVIMMITLLPLTGSLSGVTATWCVVRFEVADEALQSAMELACKAGADCLPIEGSSGPCYFPNTIQAHASYVFNSYYQLSGRSPGSCYFNGSANIAKTDPSYGSCVYPSSSTRAVRGVARPERLTRNMVSAAVSMTPNSEHSTLILALVFLVSTSVLLILI